VPVFDDLLNANRSYEEHFALKGLEGAAAKGLAVVTCMDSRIEPLKMLGLRAGDAKILRNAGARVTDDVLRTLALAVNLLGVSRIAVVAHTDCRMTKTTDDALRNELRPRFPDADLEKWDFLTVDDQPTVLRADVGRIVACELIPDDVVIGAFVYDVTNGHLNLVDERDAR
jgi:carbonic anhydrase